MYGSPAVKMKEATTPKVFTHANFKKKCKEEIYMQNASMGSDQGDHVYPSY